MSGIGAVMNVSTLTDLTVYNLNITCRDNETYTSTYRTLTVDQILPSIYDGRINMTYAYVGYNLYINVSFYDFSINYSGVYVNGVMLNNVTAGNGTWGVSFQPNTSFIADTNNCSIWTANFTATDLAGNTNSSISNFTLLPCRKDTGTAATSATRDSTSISFRYYNTSSGTTTFWLTPIAYNTTHMTCAYVCENASDAYNYNSSIFLNGDKYCEVACVSVSGDTAYKGVSYSASVLPSPINPFSPATSALVLIVVSVSAVSGYYIGSRRK
jgi:hypothetical protein